MKRYLLIFVCCFLITFTAACTQTQKDEKGNVTFYYRADTDSYQPDASIVTQEQRTVPDTTKIHNVLKTYFAGPEDNTLQSPFPKNTSLLNIEQQDDHITLTLSDSFASVTGFDRTIACVCLAKTVVDLTGCEQITILSGDIADPGCVNLTLPADSILLTDTPLDQENG